MPPNARVFISYSRQDIKWLERLRVHLKPLVRKQMIDLWDDTRIPAGMEWHQEITDALASSSVAVLLISADFLASDFIADNVLPLLLDGAAHRGTKIFSVIVSPCMYSHTIGLLRYQSVNPPDVPLVAMGTHDAEATLVKLAEAITEHTEAARGIALTPTQPPSLQSALHLAAKPADVAQHDQQPARTAASGTSPRYDVVVSFAGEDRLLVETYVTALSQAGYRVFYDAWEQHSIWGADLFQYLSAIYGGAGRVCLLFISAHYVRKAWTLHELRNAQDEALRRPMDYILPIRIDDTRLPGLPDTIGFLDVRNASPTNVTKLLRRKIGAPLNDLSIDKKLRSTNLNDCLSALARVAIQRNERHLDLLCDLLRTSPHHNVRSAAAYALDRISDERAATALLMALADPSWDVRSAAGWALVHLGEKIRDDVARVANESANQDERQMAQMILERLPPTRGGPPG